MDIAGRLGGEEFGLLLYDATPRNGLARLEGLLAAVEGLRIEHAAAATTDHVTVSIGATAFDGRESTADLYRRADAALYASKALGRNRLEFSPAPAVESFATDTRRRA